MTPDEIRARTRTGTKSKVGLVGKLYIFDPLQLTDALVSMDLEDGFLPISAGLFSVAGKSTKLTMQLV